MLFTEWLCKKSNFHCTLLPLWSAHVCALLPGFHWPLWRLAWNNGKLLTQASLLNGARKLDHCDVIASLAPGAEQSWHFKRHSRQLIHDDGLIYWCITRPQWVNVIADWSKKLFGCASYFIRQYLWLKSQIFMHVWTWGMDKPWRHFYDIIIKSPLEFIGTGIEIETIRWKY